MATDYLDALSKYHAAGGTDIKAFLDQHTQPTQTTPGPTAPPPAAPVAAQPSSPIAPAATPAPPPMINPSVNVVRSAFQAQDAAAPSTGAVGSFPRATPEARSPYNSRNLYPPLANQGRILGTSPTPNPIVSPPAATTPAAAPPLRPVTPPPTPAPVVAPTQPAVQDSDPYRFRLPSEKTKNQDFLTGGKIAANTVEDDNPPGAPNYPSSPLAMPKPTQPSAPKPTGGAMAALPRQRNQRRLDVGPSKLFAGASAA